VNPKGASSSRELAGLAVQQQAACRPNPLHRWPLELRRCPPPSLAVASTLMFRGLEGWPLYRDIQAADDVPARGDGGFYSACTADQAATRGCPSGSGTWPTNQQHTPKKIRPPAGSSLGALGPNRVPLPRHARAWHSNAAAGPPSPLFLADSSSSGGGSREVVAAGGGRAGPPPPRR
jgi:hypothetical protein